MVLSDNHVFFWKSSFSNWYRSIFEAEVEGEMLTFYNSEQYFMYIKALTFKDYDTAKKILRHGSNPKIAKDLGREVKNYDDAVWNEKRYGVMLDANMLKYSQNEELKNLLLSPKFEGKHFVEASPVDRIWGIGCGEREALDDGSNWNGQNLLGKVLDEVREKLRGS